MSVNRNNSRDTRHFQHTLYIWSWTHQYQPPAAPGDRFRRQRQKADVIVQFAVMEFREFAFQLSCGAIILTFVEFNVNNRLWFVTHNPKSKPIN